MKKEWIAAFAAVCVIALVCAGCKVVSEPEPIAVQSVTIFPTTLTLAPGDTDRLTATVVPWNADDRTVIWSSSNTLVATVDYYDGKVTAVAEGTATVTARAGGKTATCEVTVKRQVVAVDSITLDKETLTLEVDKKEKLTANVTPDDADDKTVTWSSSDTSIATVGYDGTVTAVAEGTASITAKAGGKQATCAVTVKPKDTTGHTHYFGNGGVCSTCGLPKPSMKNATIDDFGELRSYYGTDAVVIIPEGVTSIYGSAFTGKGVFSYCTNLTDVTIPEGVTSIGWNVFLGCENLTNVTLPASVTSIGTQAFYGCKSLTNVKYSGTIAQWCVLNQDYYLMFYAKHVIMNDGTDLMTMTKLVVPDSVTKIGDFAFYGCTGLTSVMIPSSVTSIGSGAFGGCTSLTSVTIPDSVTSIEGNAFNGCTSLKEIQFNGTKAQWEAIEGSDKVKIPSIRCSDGYIGVNGVPSYLVMDNAIVTGYTGEVPANLVIPKGVTSIGKGAFNGCENLTSVTIPDSVTSIGGDAFSGNGAFEGCTNLKSVEIPNSVTYIGGRAFYGCESLMDMVIPDGVTSIESNTFSGCTSLKSVKIPDGVTKIGHSAFSKCESLTSVTIPGSVTSIGMSAFSECTSLGSVTIDNGVTSIAQSMFYGCTNLTKVTIPSSVTRIEQDAFSSYNFEVQYNGTVAQWCAVIHNEFFIMHVKQIIMSDGKGSEIDLKTMTELVIPEGVTYIVSDAFRSCKNLTSVEILNGVTLIGDGAFYGCSSLASVVIPGSVTKIGDNAFPNTSLNTVKYDGTETEWKKIERYKYSSSDTYNDGLSGKTITGKNGTTWTAE